MNVSGIAVSFSVTTVTEINSIHVSYLAFQHTNLALSAGNFVFDRVKNPLQTLFYTPENPIARNYARIFGLTGLLINYSNEKLILKSVWDGYFFNF